MMKGSQIMSQMVIYLLINIPLDNKKAIYSGRPKNNLETIINLME